MNTSSNTASRTYLLTMAAAALAVVLPFLLVRYVPMVDYPNHLSRAFVIKHYADEPFFRGDYDLVTVPIPNVAMDVVMFYLQSFMHVMTAGKVFLIATVLLFVLGAHMLGKAILGRPHPCAPIVALLVFSSTFLYGFVNYVTGMALFMISLAYWLRWRLELDIPRFLLLCVLFLLTYFAHLSAYTFLGIAAPFFILNDLIERRISFVKAAVTLLPLFPPAIAFVIFMGGGGQWGDITFNSISGKLVGAFGVLRTYNVRFDEAIAIAAGAGILLLFPWRRAGSINRVAALLGVVFAIAYLACPKVLFTSWAADTRGVLPAVIIILFCYRPDLSVRREKILLSLLCVLFFARIAYIADVWRELSDDVKDVVAALDELPVHSRVFATFVLPPSDEDTTKRHVALQHVVNYAIIDRSAHVPTMFASRGSQPLLAKQPLTLSSYDSMELETLRKAGYTHYWVYGAALLGADSAAVPPKLLSETHGVSLWDIRTPS